MSAAATRGRGAAPGDEAELAEAVRGASANGRALRPTGGGTKSGFGHPVEAHRVDLSRLAGVTLYEPAALTLVVMAGTKLSEVRKVLAGEGQHLAFEPPSLARLYGGRGEATVGGTIACGLSGPRRIQAGAARDCLIGARFVTGTGEAVKSGGRVMKNVTGYDLVKLMCGAHGTLGILTELSFKLLPKPETSATVRLCGLDDAGAVAAMAAALTSPYDVTGAAHLPGGEGGEAQTLIRIEGFEKSVRYRCGRLTSLLAGSGAEDVAVVPDSESTWHQIAEAGPLADHAGAVWRLSVKPSEGPAVAAAIGGRLGASHYYDWGGGLLWLATPERDDCGARVIREAVAAAGGGHATLMRASEAVRRRVAVFQPEPAPVAALARALRAQFDPQGILNPGLMDGGAAPAEG